MDSSEVHFVDVSRDFDFSENNNNTGNQNQKEADDELVRQQAGLNSPKQLSFDKNTLSSVIQ